MERLITLATKLAAALIFALMLLTLADVIGRNLLNSPIKGATELTEIGLVGLSFLLFPTLALKDRHVVADVTDMLESRWLDVLKLVLTAVLGAGFFGVIAWRMWIAAGRAARFQDVTANLLLPIAPVLYGVALLAGLTALCFLIPLRRLPETLGGKAAHPGPDSSLL